MKRKVMLRFAAGQACFVVGLVICIALKPKGLGTNNGISYYGTFRETFLPYAISLLGFAIAGLVTAQFINVPELWPLRFGLMIFALLAAAIAFTPYSVGEVMDWLHTTAGVILFSMQLVLSSWLVVKLRYKVWALILAAVELAAGIVAAVYVLPKDGVLIQAQIIFQLVFAALMLYGFSRLLPVGELAASDSFRSGIQPAGAGHQPNSGASQ